MEAKLIKTLTAGITFPADSDYVGNKYSQHVHVSIYRRNTNAKIASFYVNSALDYNHLHDYIYSIAHVSFGSHFYIKEDENIDSDYAVSLQKLTYYIKNMKINVNYGYALDINGVNIPLKDEDIKSIKDSLGEI